MVSAFAPLAAAPPRPDNSPSNPRGGQRGGLDGKGEEGAVSAHPRPRTQGWVGGSEPRFFPGVFEAFCQGCKSGPASRERDERGGEGSRRSMVERKGSRVRDATWHVSAYYSFRIGRWLLWQQRGYSSRIWNWLASTSRKRRERNEALIEDARFVTLFADRSCCVDCRQKGERNVFLLLEGVRNSKLENCRKWEYLKGMWKRGRVIFDGSGKLSWIFKYLNIIQNVIPLSPFRTVFHLSIFFLIYFKIYAASNHIHIYIYYIKWISS